MPRGRPRGRPRKSTNGAAAPETTNPQRTAEAQATVKVIDDVSFTKLVKGVKTATADKDEAVATIGGLISAAVEKRHLHKKAFAAYRAEAKMDDGALQRYYTHLDHYRKIGGLIDRASAQTQMFEESENVVEFEPRETMDDFVPEADVS